MKSIEDRLRDLHDKGRYEEVIQTANKFTEVYLTQIKDGFDGSESGLVILSAIERVCQSRGVEYTRSKYIEIMKAMPYEVFAGLVLAGVHLIALTQAIEKAESGAEN